MNSVEPIRDKDVLIDILAYLKAKSLRDYILFMFGIYLARRITDTLSLRVCDVKNKDILYSKEKKTGKVIELPINKELKKAIKEYTTDMKPMEYLFPSQKGGHIKRGRAWQILNEVGLCFGLRGIATHSMRKTFGYWFIQNGGNIETLMEIFGHSDPAITRMYIGITSEMAKDAMANFNYF